MASVDLVARLVDAAVFRGLCSVPGVQLAAAISKGEFRNRRPDEIPSLDRAFDIDAEAEFLDWYDGAFRNVTTDEDILWYVNTIHDLPNTMQIKDDHDSEFCKECREIVD